jgi:hypothetical protein
LAAIGSKAPVLQRRGGVEVLHAVALGVELLEPVDEVVALDVRDPQREPGVGDEGAHSVGHPRGVEAAGVGDHLDPALVDGRQGGLICLRK